MSIACNKVDDIDEMKVALYVEGGWGNSLPPLNGSERREVIRALQAQGLDDTDIALRCRMNKRVVWSIRKQLGLPAPVPQKPYWEAA